jgi:hypothetical protein
VGTDIVIDPQHTEQLTGHTSLADKIRYACEQVSRPTTREVLEWLTDHGVQASRSYTTSVVRAWRQEKNLGDTGDLVAMTPELLAALDKLRPARAADPPGPDAAPPAPDPALAASGPEAVPAGRVPGALTRASGLAWLVVLAAALGISWWSLFEFARTFAIPVPLAAVMSLVFDASALIVAHLAHRYAVSPDSGAGARLSLVALLAGSIYLNWEHAVSKGYGVEASIMFAAPAAVAIVLFELQTGWHSRTARRNRGRVARPLPVIGPWGWLFHPLQSITTVWSVTRAHGRVVRTTELSHLEQMRARRAGTHSAPRAAVPAPP